MSQSLDDWLKRITKESIPGIQLGLNRCRQLLGSLDCQNNTSLIVTVGGTNGKGSSVAMLEAILLEYGYKVGTYTSPHIHKINERIRSNGVEISDQQLVHCFKKISENQEANNLTFFEYITLAALYFFSKQNLDIVILEVGLGGRLDAVNCVDADIALISAVDIDHTEFLGDNREQIGFEKAGIMRTGKHAVCSDNDIPSSIFQHAKDNNVSLSVLGVDFYINNKSEIWQWWAKGKKIEGKKNDFIRAEFQLRNLSGVLQVLELLKLDLSGEKIQKALDSIRLRGRFEVLTINNKEWIIDVAHNCQASKSLVSSMKKLPKIESNLGVFALQKTKNLQRYFQPLVALVDFWFLPDLNERIFWKTQEIQSFLEYLGVDETHIFNFNSVSDALDEINTRRANERILVAGSFVIVQQVLEKIDTC